MNILLDYVFKASSVTPTAAASTGFLKQVCVVVKPDTAVTTGVITSCVSQTAVADLTLNTETEQLFSAGLSRIYVLPMDDLDLATALEGHESDFFTVLISSDFSDAEIALLDVGEFTGVVGLYSNTTATVASYAAVESRAGFYGSTTNKAKSMFYAFGSLLANALDWANQQYITMPLSDDVATLGAAEAFFDDKVSFVISDDEYSNRLALFAAGGKAIVAPYIRRNLELNLQSAALSYISGNQPAYTKKYATLLENELKDVIQDFIDRQWIEAGEVSVLLENDNFVASGYINIAEPKALWRVFAEMSQTL